MLAKFHGHLRSGTIFEKSMSRRGYNENNTQRLLYECNFLLQKKE
jgi:hypothetical protein